MCRSDKFDATTTEYAKTDKIKIIDVSGILAETIRRTHNGESVSTYNQTSAKILALVSF